MAVSDYTGRFGDTLRRLVAAEAQSGAFGGSMPPAPASPQAPGVISSQLPSYEPAPGTGPIASVGPQAVGGADVAQPQINAPAFQTAAQAAPASQPALQAAQGPAGGSPQIGLQDIFSKASAEDMEQATKQLEAKGVDVPAKYQELVDQGAIKIDDKPDRKEMGLRLMEFGLRMMAATSQGMDPFGAAGVAGLGVMQSIETRKAQQLAMSETRRKEQREDVKEERKAKREEAAAQTEREFRTTERKAGQEFTAEEHELDRKNREALERIRAAAEKAKARGQRAQFYIDENGELSVVDPETNAAEPVMKDQPVTKRGKRGVETTVTEKVPFKPKPKPDPFDRTEITEAQYTKAVQDTAKALTEDRAFVNQLRQRGVTDIPGEIQAEATRRVDEALTRARGAGGTSGSPATPFSDLMRKGVQ